MSKVLVDRELKPCPFCGGTDFDVSQWIECNACGAFGPTPDDNGDYATGWNRRAQPAEAEGVDKWSELKKLAEKATPGPWWVDSHGHRFSTEDGMQTVFIAADKMGPATRHPETGNLSHWPNDWDASYIVNASPDKILELIATLSAVTAERDRLRKDRDDCLEARQYYADKYGEVIAERDQLRAEVEAMRALLSKSLPVVEAHAGASHMLEGFRPIRNKWDELVDGIRAAMAAKEA